MSRRAEGAGRRASDSPVDDGESDGAHWLLRMRPMGGWLAAHLARLGHWGRIALDLVVQVCLGVMVPILTMLGWVMIVGWFTHAPTAPDETLRSPHSDPLAETLAFGTVFGWLVVINGSAVCRATQIGMLALWGGRALLFPPLGETGEMGD